MGSSQILLLILALVILGIALATGIDLFKTQRRQAERDRVFNDINRIAHDIQVWKIQPAELDGGSKKPLSAVEFDRLYRETAPCDAMAGPLGAGETCYFQEQELRYILSPEAPNVRVVALSQSLGLAANDYRLAEALITGTRPEDVEITLVR